jgi:hypothetical protein
LSTYKDTRKQIKQVNKAIEAADTNDVELSEWFARHNDIVDNEANRNICRQYFAGDDITLEALEESYSGHPRFKDMLCTQSEKELRDTLEAKIVSLLEGGTSKENIRAAQSTFRFKSTAELKAKLAELERRVEFRSKTPQELREIIKRPQPGHSDLPVMYQHLEMLLTLPPDRLRHFITKFGSQAINKVLNQKEK